MKDFRLYDIADFVMDEEFIRWVQQKSPADNLFWENWLLQNPARHLIIAEARQIVEFVQLEQQTVVPAEIQAEIAKVLQTIEQTAQTIEQPGQTIPQTERTFGQREPTGSKVLQFASRRATIISATAVAAVALLVVTGLPRLIPRSKPQSSPAKSFLPVADLIEKTNTSEKPLVFDLPDGSAVRLAPGSKVSYPTVFVKEATRDVYLTGEAFFTIAKNPARPFRVLTGELVTRVLGTTFSIRGFEGDTIISVTVRTGKVSVWSQTADPKEANSDGFIVTPNQQLVYHREVKKFQKVLVEKPLFIVSDTVDHSMTYEDTPVEQVFDQLGKYYGINIVYDSELLGKCTVTADLANEPFYHKLDLICKAIGANYEIVDAQVVILSNGCQ